jgi:hypothetical protein
MNFSDLTLARWRERRRAPVELDLADMGTAFGLDASLDPSGSGTAGVANTVPESGSALPAPDAPSLRWWKRRGSSR